MKVIKFSIRLIFWLLAIIAASKNIMPPERVYFDWYRVKPSEDPTFEKYLPKFVRKRLGKFINISAFVSILFGGTFLGGLFEKPAMPSLPHLPPCMQPEHLADAANLGVHGLQDFIDECRASGGDLLHAAYDKQESSFQ
jgi:hypothetical protein